MFRHSLVISLAAAALFFSGCKKSSSTDSVSEDTSVSGSVAGSIGGALTASDASGTVASYEGRRANTFLGALLQQPAYAAGICPKITTPNGSGCNNGGNYVSLDYSSCSFANSLAMWSGTLEVSLASGGAISCGAFPAPTSTSINRQFVSSHGVPGTGSRTTPAGTVVQIDHASANLANFDNQSVSATIGTGYGTSVSFNGGGQRNGVVIRQRTHVSGGFDHSVVGNISVISDSGGSRTVSGSVTVYHNVIKVVGTSTFSNVVYNNSSCAPISGTITTSFAAGANVSPTIIGSAFVGKSESLSFNADGTATHVDYAGNSTTVTISRCY